MKLSSSGREQSAASFRLCFRSLSREGRDYSFACDARGDVDLDALSEVALNNYLFARNAVGREFAAAEVQPGE